MATVASILAELKKKGTAQTRKTYVRHGIPAERTFGVSAADLKAIAKSIKGQQALACELYETGNMDAMYLAGLVANGATMTTKQLNDWAENSAPMPMIAEYTVPWVAVEHPQARDLAIRWMKSKNEYVASAGWRTYGGLLSTKADEALDLNEIYVLLNTVVKTIGGAQNRVRYTMNGFVIAVGIYVRPLLKEAMAAAERIGAVSVEMGDTECKVPLAAEYIRKIEGSGRLGQKRKMMRC